MESIGHACADGRAHESTCELFQPPAGGLLVGEPDDLTPGGSKAILKGPDGVGPACLTKRPRRLGGLRKRTRVRDRLTIPICVSNPVQDALSCVSAHSMPSSQSSRKVGPFTRGVSRPMLHSWSSGRRRTIHSGKNPAIFPAHP